MKGSGRHKLLFAAVIAVALFISSCGSGSFNWSETYYRDSKQPYGTYVISEMLDKYNSPSSLKEVMGPLQKELDLSKITSPSNYVFIGENLYLGEQGTQSLLDFVRAGNQAFISTKELPTDLARELRSVGCSYNNLGTLIEGIYDTVAVANFYHPDIASNKGYHFRYVDQNVPGSHKWKYISIYNICDTARSVVHLGYIGKRLTNFIKVPYGKGNIYLHTTPIAFTNYYMISDRGLSYAGRVFANLGPGDIYWDEFSRLPAQEVNDKPRSTPLQYILAQPSLKWAWYLTLILTSIFILFRSKRKQRVIPVMAENENTSLEFVQTIGTLYFQQNDHKKLAQQKMKLFLQHIRNRYSIPTNQLTQETLKRISIKSQIPYSQVEDIFEQYSWIKEQPGISDENLIKFHLSIDNFYKNAK